MTLEEKVEFLENRLGKYETWTDEQLFAIAQNSEYESLFDAELANEFMKRANSEMFFPMESMHYSFLLAESNKKFVDLINIFETDIKTVNETLEENLTENKNIFDKLNTYLMVLSQDEHIDGKKLLEFVKEEDVKGVLNEAQNIIVGIDSNFGMLLIQSLSMLIYRIQEYYFELYQKDILEKNPEFEKKIEEIDKITLEMIQDAFNQYNDQEEE